MHRLFSGAYRPWQMDASCFRGLNKIATTEQERPYFFYIWMDKETWISVSHPIQDILVAFFTVNDMMPSWNRDRYCMGDIWWYRNAERNFRIHVR